MEWLIFLPLIPISALLWMLRCNNLAYKQRGAIIERMPRDRFDQFLRDFKTVDYSQHMRRLMLLRDPLQLYPPTIRALYGAADLDNPQWWGR